MGIDPVDRESVGRKQLERAIALDGLQRPHPGVEMLARELVFERTDAARPQRALHVHAFARRCCHGCLSGWPGKRGSESSRSRILFGEGLLTPGVALRTLPA